MTGFRMADLVDRVPREVARLDPASLIRCTVPASGPAGTWALSADAVQQGQGITRADQTAALTKAAAFRSLLMEPYAGTLRIESEGQRFVRKAEPPVDGPLVFGFEAMYLMSICDTTSGDVHEIGSTRSQATLVANDLGDFFSSFGEPVEMAGAPVQLFQLAPRDGTVGGLLARPAVLASFGFRGEFSDDDTRAGRAIVRLNPQYFAKDRPHDVPVLALQWEWSEGHPQDEAWRMRFEGTVPFARLQALLDPR
ncbi:MAG: hypothetical protein IT180_07625 [Acidobacteria bacterium]|nr:hypothetical protein [Acidobacteriota bacterium]